MNKPLLLLTTLSFCIAQVVLAQKQEIYSRVKVFATHDQHIKLMQKGVPFDELAEKNANYVVGDFSESDIRLIKAEKLKVQYLITDLAADFKKRNAAAAETARLEVNTSLVPPGFNYGSMGGYLTLAEMEKELDSLKLDYPNLITSKVSIGTSLEGRPIWMVKISDNPDVDENEPEVFLNGLIHAREPISMTNLIYFMQFILANYNDPDLNCLINNREIYVVACTNPDGYAYNESTNPAGGGLWRKNRRTNGDGSFGVDLNRNFGYNWGYDNTGSSPLGSSDSYRGSGPFSEPETQVIRDFCIAHQFKNTLNHHSYANTFNTPWGYINQATPDNTHYLRWGAVTTVANGYTVGTSFQNLGYVLNGGANDWMYGDQVAKNKIFAAVMESGSSTDGFWPVQSRIIPLNQAALLANINTCWAAGDFFIPAIAANTSVSGTSASLPFTVTNYGLETGTVETVNFITTDPRVVNTGVPVSLNGMAVDAVLNTSVMIDFAVNAAPGTISGNLRLTTKDGCSIDEPVSFNYLGVCNPLLSGWTAGDIGTVGLNGYLCYNNGTYTVNGSGTGLASTSDQYYLVKTSIIGNYTITARLNSVQNTSAAAKAGIVITESTATGAKRVSLCLIPSTGKIEFQSRKTTGAKVTTTATANGTTPRWLKITRNSNTFTAYYSTNGTTWTLYNSANITMASSIYAGLAVTSGTNSALNASVFDNVSVSSGVQLQVAVNDNTMKLRGMAETKEFTLYPNPAVGNTIYVRFTSANESGNGFIQITDISGKLVQNMAIKINKGINNIAVENLGKMKPGTYLVTVKGYGVNYRSKLIVAK